MNHELARKALVWRLVLGYVGVLGMVLVALRFCFAQHDRGEGGAGDS
jgi:hypothetical protein